MGEPKSTTTPLFVRLKTTYFFFRWCHGKHELRKSVACHIDGISCGKRCGKPLSCNKHFCVKTCHPGDCDPQCNQACNEIRTDSCGHPCGAPCHGDSPCPTSNPCMEKVKLTCECGNLSTLAICSANTTGTMHSGLLAAQIRDLNAGNNTISLNINGNDIFIDISQWVKNRKV